MFQRKELEKGQRSWSFKNIKLSLEDWVRFSDSKQICALGRAWNLLIRTWVWDKKKFCLNAMWFFLPRGLSSSLSR
jgi:hypothetical protein